MPTSPISVPRSFWLALAAAAWLACAPAARAEEAAPAVAPVTRQLELIYTGMTGGLSSGNYDFSELNPLFTRPEPRDFEVGGYVQDNVFRHGPFMIYTAQGPLTLEDFRAFFAAGPFELTREGTRPLIASDYGYVLQPAADDAPWLLRWLADALQASGRYPDARWAEGTRFRITNRAGFTLSLLSLDGEPPALDVLEHPSRWEMVPAVAVAARRAEGPTRLMAVARPLGDGLRRAWLMDHMREGKRGRVLTVDLGNLLDPGFSELSRQQREFTYMQLDRLAYDAMVPAETELGLPPADWERLVARVPMIAANLTPNTPGAERLPGYRLRTVDGLRVALVGVVDDQVLTREGAAGPGLAWTATDPVAAVKSVMAELAPLAPDATLLLTNVRDDRLQQFRHIPGLTAILADFQGLPGERFVESATHSGMNRLRVATAYMIANSSRNRVGRLVADFEQAAGRPPALTRLTNHAELVTDRLPYDEQGRWQLNVTQDRYQATRRALVLPDLRDAIAATPGFKPAELDSALPRIEWQLWSRVVANVLREATGAEVAIARQVPMRGTTVGPVSQLMVEGWLETGDRLVQTTLSGKALKALAAKDGAGRLLSFSGYDPANQKVHGYDLADAELYRVTTTDQVVRHARFAEFFAGRPLAARWRTDSAGRARPDAEGERPELRAIVLDFLKALKQAHGGAFSPAYMAEYGRLLATGDQFTAPRWMVSLDDGQLLLNSYRNQNTAPFAQVRNTRVNTPSSFALGGKGRVAVIYDSPELAWENRAKSIYRRATLTKDGVEVTQETDDEIVLTSELRLKALRVPLAAQPFPLVPFVNANYATEFTPGQANGQEKPRRAELNAVSGLILNPGWGLKELRAGAVLKNDLANPGALEPGLQAIALYEQKLSETWPAVLRGGIDVTRYWNTPTDTPDRLGLLADFTAGLTIPLWDRFSFTLSADYFLFQGKVPATDVLGTSLDFKVGIGYSMGFKPFYGVWF